MFSYAAWFGLGLRLQVRRESAGDLRRGLSYVGKHHKITN